MCACVRMRCHPAVSRSAQLLRRWRMPSGQACLAEAAGCVRAPSRCSPAVSARRFGCGVMPGAPSPAHLIREAGAGGRVVLEVLPAAAIPILDDQVDGHLSLEAGDVAVTEVVAQVVDLRGHRGTGGATRGPGLGCTGMGAAFCSNSSGQRA